MLNLVMLGREAKRRAHVVELNQPRLDEEEKK